MKVVQQQTCLRYPVPIVWPIPPVSCCTGCISPVRGSCGRVELFFNSSFINIMHIHEAFKFFLISKKLLCFTLYVDCLSLMKIYSMHELFFFCGFPSVTGTYKYNIQCHAVSMYSRGHVGNVVYPCAYDLGFNTWLGALFRSSIVAFSIA